MSTTTDTPIRTGRRADPVPVPVRAGPRGVGDRADQEMAWVEGRHEHLGRIGTMDLPAAGFSVDAKPRERRLAGVLNER